MIPYAQEWEISGCPTSPYGTVEPAICQELSIQAIAFSTVGGMYGLTVVEEPDARGPVSKGGTAKLGRPGKS